MKPPPVRPLPLLLLLAVSLAQCAPGAGPNEASVRFFSSNEVIRLRIVITPADSASLKADPRQYVRATVWEGETEYADVALRLKGSKLGSFRPLEEKPALTLNFDKFVKDREFHGLDKVYLNNSVEDPSYMTEHLCGGLFREAGVPAPRISFARVEINGLDRGLYVLKEGFDKAFLKGWFDDNDGNLYDCGTGGDVTDPLKLSSGDKRSTGEDLKALAAAALEPDPDRRWTELGKVLDRPRFISFIALEVMTSHWDGYGLNRNNYRLYHDPGTGKLIFMPHGMDLMFEHEDAPLIPEFEGLVAKAIIGTGMGRSHYLARAKQLQTHLLTREILNQRIDALQARIRPVLEAIHPQAATAHDRDVRILRQRIAGRIQFLESQLQ